MKSFGLVNVKAFENTGDIELTPITIFVGQNSCGKSSIIRFPAVISQSLGNKDSSICLHSNKPGMIDFGNISDVIHNQNGKTFAFTCRYNYNQILSNCDGRRFVSDPNTKTMETDLAIDVDQFVDAFMKDGSIDPYKLDVKVTISFGRIDNEKDSAIILKKFEVFYDDIPAFSFEHKFRDFYQYKQKKMISNGQIVDAEFDIRQKVYSMPGLGTGISFPAKCTEQIVKKYVRIGTNKDKAVIMSLIGKSILGEEDDDYPFIVVEYNENEIHEKNAWIEQNEELYRKLQAYEKGYRQAAEIVNAIYKLIKKDFCQVKYIGPFREYPQRIYRREDISTGSVGINGENTSSILINDKINKGKVIHEVSDWFNSAFSLGVDVQELVSGEINSGYYQIMLTEKKKKEATKKAVMNNIMDVGFGISQILPIVTQIASAIVDDNESHSSPCDKHNSGLCIIEQPELHLHPNAQAELSTLFASLINKTYGRQRLLIETHSEHLIRSIQTLIAKRDSPFHIDKNDVSIYYVHSEGERNGHNQAQTGSWIEKMEMDENGQFISKWPSGFFDKAYQLTRELAQSILSRSKEGSESK